MSQNLPSAAVMIWALRVKVKKCKIKKTVFILLAANKISIK